MVDLNQDLLVGAIWYRSQSIIKREDDGRKLNIDAISTMVGRFNFKRMAETHVGDDTSSVKGIQYLKNTRIMWILNCTLHQKVLDSKAQRTLNMEGLKPFEFESNHYIKVKEIKKDKWQNYTTVVLETNEVDDTSGAKVKQTVQADHFLTSSDSRRAIAG